MSCILGNCISHRLFLPSIFSVSYQAGLGENEATTPTSFVHLVLDLWKCHKKGVMLRPTGIFIPQLGMSLEPVVKQLLPSRLSPLSLGSRKLRVASAATRQLLFPTHLVKERSMTATMKSRVDMVAIDRYSPATSLRLLELELMAPRHSIRKTILSMTALRHFLLMTWA